MSFSIICNRLKFPHIILSFHYASDVEDSDCIFTGRFIVSFNQLFRVGKSGFPIARKTRIPLKMNVDIYKHGNLTAK